MASQLVGELAGVDEERRPASLRTIAKESGAACGGTSAPRMLSAQATAWESETTSASARSLANLGTTRAASRSRLRRRARVGCRVTAPSGGAGRSGQIDRADWARAATSVAPTAAQALRSRSTLSAVCSQGRSRAGRRREVAVDPVGRAASFIRVEVNRSCRSGRAPEACSGRRRRTAAFSIITMAAPAEPVKPVSQASRSARIGTYSP